VIDPKLTAAMPGSISSTGNEDHKPYTKLWLQSKGPNLSQIVSRAKHIFADYLLNIDLYPEPETSYTQASIAFSRAKEESTIPPEQSYLDKSRTAMPFVEGEIISAITNSAITLRNTGKRKAEVIVQGGKYYPFDVDNDEPQYIKTVVVDLKTQWKFAHKFSDEGPVQMFQHPALEELLKRLYFQSRNESPIAAANGWETIPLLAYAFACTALWAVFEQYEASGKRDDNYKFEASEYFHHVYDSVAEALEQFDQLPMSGELFREHRKALTEKFTPRQRLPISVPPVVFHVLPGEEVALLKIQSESSDVAQVESSGRRSRRRNRVTAVVDDYGDA